MSFAFSPIDLIPDPIPVLGYLDDLLLIPLGVSLALKIIPGPVMAESRGRAHEIMAAGKPASRAAAGVIILIWLLAASLLVWWVLHSGFANRFLAVH